MDNTLDMVEVTRFANESIQLFHKSKLAKIRTLKLKDILRKKNPYLFKAKGIQNANELVSGIVEATISSSEETLFGQFLEDLALFITSSIYNAVKSSANGIDIEFVLEGEHNLVSIKSGVNWGNSSQHKELDANFRKAKQTLIQSGHVKHVKAVLGIAYGKTKYSYTGVYHKYVGQQFWHFISGSESLYIDIIEPIGYMAKEKNEAYHSEKAKAVNLLVKELLSDFCLNDGGIDWEKLVRFNSGNMEQ